jgi:hypothetical protein
MPKPFAVFVVLVFFWLQTYQLCDASEDTIEDLPVAAQMSAGSRAVLSTPTPPDDDMDGNIPSVFDQTLVHGHVFILSPLAAGRLLTHSSHAATDTLALKPTLRDHSPPGRPLVSPAAIGSSNEPFILSSRSLAPPAA